MRRRQFLAVILAALFGPRVRHVTAPRGQLAWIKRRWTIPDDVRKQLAAVDTSRIVSGDWEVT